MQGNSTARRPSTAVLLAALVLVSALFVAAYRVYYRQAYPLRYEDLVLEQSERHGLPPSLVFAVIRTESGFRAGAQSGAGARGLMQLTEETFDWVMYRTGQTGHSFGDLYGPALNIEYGAALLRLLLDEFGSPWNALCAYHAGWGSAKEWLANPEHSPDGQTIHNIPFGDTERYVQKVLATREIYQNMYQIS